MQERLDDAASTSSTSSTSRVSVVCPIEQVRLNFEIVNTAAFNLSSPSLAAPDHGPLLRLFVDKKPGSRGRVSGSSSRGAILLVVHLEFFLNIEFMMIEFMILLLGDEG